MQSHTAKPKRKSVTFTRYLKFSTILLLFLLSVLIIACGGNQDNTTATGPAPTVTIQLGKNGAPPGAPSPYTCGAWATNTSPTVGTAQVGIYAKFVQNISGIPSGVSGAQATATVYWPDGPQTFNATTTPDGLAAFAVPIAGRADAINRVTIVTVTFSKPGIPNCTVDQIRGAYFTVVPGGAGPGTGAPQPTASPQPGMTPGVPLPTPTPMKKKHG